MSSSSSHFGGAPERLLKNLSCLSVGRGQEVCIYPERGRSPAGVADPARHRPQVDPAGDELGGRVMPQIVQPCPEAEPSGQPREPVRHRVRVYGLPASWVEGEHT